MANQLFKTPESSYVSSADLSAKQYYFVKLDASDEIELCSAITDIPLGVLQNAPEAGQVAVVRTIGNTKVVANGAIARDVDVGPATTGKAQTAVSTQFPCGRVIHAAAADEDLMVIRLFDTAVALA